MAHAPNPALAAAVADRQQRLQQHLAERGLAAAVISRPRSMYYLTGYNTVIYSRPQYLVVFASQSSVLVLPKVRLQAATRAAQHCEIVPYWEFAEDFESRTANASLVKTLRDRLAVPSRVAVELGHLPTTIHRLLEGDRGSAVADIGPVVDEMRTVKDEVELEFVRRAALIADAGMGAAADGIEAGATEIEINNLAEAAMRNFWAREFPHDAITGFGDDQSGPASALYCWTRSDERQRIALPASTHLDLPRGAAVLVVIWTSCNGYCAEYERTIFKGEIPQERAGAYEAMLDARTATRAMLRPGVRRQDLVDAASATLREHGFDPGPGFIGHGIGLGHQEPPHIVPGVTGQLESGSVLAIEPGIQFKTYGVRHSDTVVVTDGGSQSLTPWDSYI